MIVDGESVGSRATDDYPRKIRRKSWRKFSVLKILNFWLKHQKFFWSEVSRRCAALAFGWT